MIFELNNTDYTKYLQDDTYNVVQVDIGDSWTDANYKKHANHVYKVQGSFSMAFVNDSDYTQFLSDVESAKNNDGNVECNVFVINKNTTMNIECFMAINSKQFRPVNTTTIVNIIDVQINEA